MAKLPDLTTSRRAVLGAGVACCSLLAMPAILRAQGRSIRIGVYGGYFKSAFDKHIFPEFTKATGIAVVSVAQPSDEVWLADLEQASRSGQAPVDISMMSQTPLLMGQSTRLWAPLDLTRISNSANLIDHFVNRYADGAACGIGAVAWYITLVTNINAFPAAPDSWSAFWDPANVQVLGLPALASNSYLLDVTARTFMGGASALDTDEGIQKAFEKLAEIKPNVRLWYRDDAEFEQALTTGEAPMGQYYHDVTSLMAAKGLPVRSTFPREGGVQDSGSWVLLGASQKTEEAHAFIDHMCQPAVQTALSSKVGASPTIKRELLDLTPEEFAAVSSDIEPIIPRYDLYAARADWISQKWTELIVG